MSEKVPSISIQNLRHSPEERNKLLKGLTQVGFLYICDHGVPASITERVKKVSPDVFLADKWERQKISQWREGKLSYGDIYNEKDERVVNEKSDVKLDKKEIDETFFDYISEMYRIGETLVYWIEKVLGLKNGALSQAYGSDPILVQHINYYHIKPAERWAFVEHVDSSILTFLMQSEVGGLEMDFNGTWEEVPFRPNTFTVNLGNILEHATFGVVKATWHRVRMPANQKRHQWPTFFTLSPESSLFQIKDFAWNKDNYQKRLIEERERIIGNDNRHQAEVLTPDTNILEWLKSHSKEFEARKDFPKVDSQILEMVSRKQADELGYDVAENEFRYKNYESRK
ncbi:unnamed protein product [Oikopleura dioica]|uniref:Fe2OG dioxygenase domain-containing protein n=1 Tax=Oikopleura dioica TaxID=34765 RepID=E4Z279_OIKDI|nr:unnamed protein product [Oikopleura dioica]